MTFAFLVRDLLGLGLAVLVVVVGWVLPADALRGWLARSSPAFAHRRTTPLIAMLGFPPLDVLVVGATNVRAAAVLHVVAGLILVAVRLRARRRRADGAWSCPAAARAGMALWFAYLVAMYVDVDIGGRLYQSVLVYDLVKHAAVVNSIAEYGLPLVDPFFLRDSPAAYYHYFYVGPALATDLSDGIISPRMAFVGFAFVTGIAFACLLSLLTEQSPAGGGAGAWTVVLVCGLGGLDVLPTLLKGLGTGTWPRSPEWWESEISLFPTTGSWVPQHLLGLVAAASALCLVVVASRTPTRRARVTNILGAAACLATMFGSSVWIAVVAASVLLLFPVCLRPGERARAFGLAAAAAGIAATVSSAQIVALLAGRSQDGAIGFQVRDSLNVGKLVAEEPARSALALLASPPSYVLEFGALAFGAVLWWRQRRNQPTSIRDRVLLLSLATGTVVNLTIASQIISNDLGWRAALLVALPLMIWSVEVVNLRPPGRVLSVLIALGLATTAYSVIGARLLGTVVAPSRAEYINADPELDLQTANAYLWARRHLPVDAVLQHDATSTPRSFDFGLYGRQRTWVADSQARLFGANDVFVQARLAAIQPFFGEGDTTAPGLEDVDYWVVTDRADVWAGLDRQRCAYLDSRVCVLPNHS